MPVKCCVATSRNTVFIKVYWRAWSTAIRKPCRACLKTFFSNGYSLGVECGTPTQFFADMAVALGIADGFENPLQTRVTELEKQNSDLQLQIKTLEKAIELMGRRG